MEPTSKLERRDPKVVKSPSNEAVSKMETTANRGEPGSSGDDDDEFILKKLLKKDQIKLKDEFRADIETSVKYLTALKGLTDALQKMVISGASYHFDEKRKVPFSGWRYLTGYLQEINYSGKANRTEKNGIIEVCDGLGWAEERTFEKIRNPDERSNIYLAVGDQREKMEQASKAIALSIKTCNRRRKKVEKAVILRDLKDQCPKYKAAVLQLDDECRDMENYRTNIRYNRPHHLMHIRKSLKLIYELSLKKQKLLKENAAKRGNTSKVVEEKKEDIGERSFMKRISKSVKKQRERN